VYSPRSGNSISLVRSRRSLLARSVISGARCPNTTGRDCDRQSGGGWGEGVGLRLGVFVNRLLLPSLSLSCRNLYSPCVGSASFNNVDQPRSDLYFRHQPARRDFRIGYEQCLLLARSAVLWPVSPYVATLFRCRAPASSVPRSETRRECVQSVTGVRTVCGDDRMRTM
jgi:hypothetical protein